MTASLLAMAVRELERAQAQGTPTKADLADSAHGRRRATAYLPTKRLLDQANAILW